jgi:hypothetical protein
VVLADGSVREVVVTQHESGQWLARVPGVWGEEHGVTPASAVTRLVLSVGWALREILAGGEFTRAEAIAAERERCARVCDGLADEAQREVSEARGDTLAVEWFKGRRSGARECAAKIRAGGV